VSKVITVAGMPQSGSTLLFNILATIMSEFKFPTSALLFGPNAYSRVINAENLRAYKEGPAPDHAVIMVKEHHFEPELAELSEFIFITKRDIRDSIASRRRRGKPLYSKGKRSRDLHKYDEKSFAGFTAWCDYLTQDCYEDWLSWQKANNGVMYLFSYEHYQLSSPEERAEIIQSMIDFLGLPAKLDTAVIANAVTPMALTDPINKKWAKEYFFKKDMITNSGAILAYQDQLSTEEIDYIESNYGEHILNEHCI
tara:strand:- start:2081 stop:2842 length:762 start_codon:yes stop_codon:yes gene_type:complete